MNQIQIGPLFGEFAGQLAWDFFNFYAERNLRPAHVYNQHQVFAAIKSDPLFEVSDEGEFTITFSWGEKDMVLTCPKTTKGILRVERNVRLGFDNEVLISYRLNPVDWSTADPEAQVDLHSAYPTGSLALLSALGHSLVKWHPPKPFSEVYLQHPSLFAGDIGDKLIVVYEEDFLRSYDALTPIADRMRQAKPPDSNQQPPEEETTL